MRTQWLVLPMIGALAAPAFAADYQLKATPSTVAWGYYWLWAKPVLRIRSGDTVEIQTTLTNIADRLASVGIRAEEIESEIKAIYCVATDKAAVCHVLTVLI